MMKSSTLLPLSLVLSLAMSSHVLGAALQEQLKKHLLAACESSAFGNQSGIYVYRNGYVFLLDSPLAHGPSAGKPACREGKLPKKVLEEVKGSLKSSGLLDAQFTQAPDPTMVSEGSSTLFIQVEGRKNHLSPPVVGIQNEETKAISEKISKLTRSIRQAVVPHLKPAREGFWIRVHGPMPLKHAPSRPKAYSKSKLPKILEKTMVRGGFVYFGEKTKEREAFHRHSYSYRNRAFLSMLHHFDGKNFKRLK